MRLWGTGVTILLVSMLLALSCGVVCFSPLDTLQVLLGQVLPQSMADVRTVVLELRLPRVIMAAHAGAVLSLGGLAFQTVLRNPLAEPYLLGVSGGAALGVMVGVLAGWSLSFFPALAGGLAVLALALHVGRMRSAQGLLLSGVMINAFCGAVILLLLSLAAPADMSALMFWSMGNLANLSLEQSLWCTVAFAPGYALLLRLGRCMNLLLLGDDAAHGLGVSVRCMTFVLVGSSSVMVSGLVAAVGPLGFVGLVVPQILRLVLGNDCRRLAPGCLLLGATFMVLCDVASRLLPTQGELPAGVLTALVGAPLFVLLLRREE